VNVADDDVGVPAGGATTLRLLNCGDIPDSEHSLLSCQPQLRSHIKVTVCKPRGGQVVTHIVRVGHDPIAAEPKICVDLAS
jgi:hypothetical protein